MGEDKGEGGGRQRRVDAKTYNNQFSAERPGTRWKYWGFPETRVRFRTSAIAAIRKAVSLTGFPFRANETLISP